MKQRGLGKGLSALLSDVTTNEDESQVIEVPIIDIEPNPWQPRKIFDETSIQELKESIDVHGVIQPIIVQDTGTSYTIIAGERRWRAARLAGLTEIPAIVRSYSQRELLEVALVENIQRQDLNAIELAQAYEHLAEEFSLTQEEVAAKVGKSRSAVANIMRLLKLSLYVQERVSDGAISYGHARAILAIENEQMQKEITDEIIASQLSVRETEKLIQKLSEVKEEKKAVPINPFYKEIQEGLQKILGTKVQITQGKKKGKIEIEYYSEDELERIIGLIKQS